MEAVRIIGKIFGSVETADGTTQTAYIAVKPDGQVVISAETLDDWEGVEDSPIGTQGTVVMAEAKTGQKGAVSDGDAVIPVANAHGELVTAGHTWSTNSNRGEEVDPISAHHVPEDLVDTTDVSAATHYYPSSTGGSMDGFTDYSLTGKLIDGDGTLTLTLEVSNDEDAASADWVPAHFYDDELNAITASKTVTNGTELMALSLNNNNFRLYRWVVVANGATNTVILKGRKKY